MKPILSLRRHRRSTSRLRRDRLLSEFARSGLSAAAFARQHGIAYTTFCSWRRRQAVKPSHCFAEVELVRPPSAEPIVLELGRQARMRLSSAGQLELAASLLKHLEATC